MAKAAAIRDRRKKVRVPPAENTEVTAAVGMPAASENRTVTGVDGRVACGAVVSFAASGVGVNVPAYIVPCAWAGRKPGCTPPDSLSRTSSRSVMS